MSTRLTDAELRALGRAATAYNEGSKLGSPELKELARFVFWLVWNRVAKQIKAREARQ